MAICLEIAGQFRYSSSKIIGGVPLLGVNLKESARVEELLDEVSASITRVVFARFHSLTREEREEIGQEVRLKILKMAADGKKIDNFRSYIWRVVYTTALDVIEERMNFHPVEQAVCERYSTQSAIDFDSPQSLLEEKELRFLVEQGVGVLPPRRRVVMLLYLKGMGLEEMAEFLGWSRNTVRHLLYRGIDELKRKVTQSRNVRLTLPGQKAEKGA